MTSPPEKIRVTCPDCGTEYVDWWRPSINLALDDFDEEYLDQASSAVCPECGLKVYFDQLVVTRDWEFQVRARAADALPSEPENGDG